MDATPDSPIFPGAVLPSASMATFRVTAPLQPSPHVSNAQQFLTAPVPPVLPVPPTAPSQAEILEAQRKDLEKIQRQRERANAKELRRQQKIAAQERAARERAAQEWPGPMQPHGQQTVFTAYPNGQTLPSAVVPVQRSTPASGGSTTRLAPNRPASQIPRNNPQGPSTQPPPCPLCSGPHESGKCPALNDLSSLYFFREQIQNEPGIETLEERVSGFTPIVAYSDDPLSETLCMRLTTSSPKPRHDSELLHPSHLCLRQLSTLIYPRALPHLPETLLRASGLKEFQDHPCPVHLLRPNARLKASHRTNGPANAPNTTPFPR